MICAGEQHCLEVDSSDQDHVHTADANALSGDDVMTPCAVASSGSRSWSRRGHGRGHAEAMVPKNSSKRCPLSLLLLTTKCPRQENHESWSAPTREL